jgi:hypothetical protein
MSRIALVAALALVALNVQAQDPAKKAADPKAAAAMEAMMKHGTPAAAHKKLEPMVGSWTFVGKMYEDPAAPPSEFKGTAERKWILDGRFLLDETKADFGGMPFQGIGYTGYDNTLKKYNGLWLDNMTTSVMTLTGTLDAAGKVLTSEFESVDPVAGKPEKGREVVTLISNDEHKMEMYKLEGGKAVKMMEIVYKRKK